MGSFKNLCGERFGNLVVIECNSTAKNGKKIWKCKCDCGNETFVRTDHLTRGETLNCKRCGINKVLDNHVSTNKFEISGNMVIGITTTGKKFIFDKDDLEKVSKYSWNYDSRGYIFANANEPNKRKIIYLHRLVLGFPKNMIIDHKNRIPYDCRKSNLRICTESENHWNRGKSSNNTSGYKGVFWNKRKQQWETKIGVNKRVIFLGYFDSLIEAILAYNRAALKYHGEFALLNVIEDEVA